MSNQADEQVDDLKELVDQVEKGESESNTAGETHLNDKTTKEAATKEIDVLDLPPRNEVHSNKKERVHLKISIPLIRLFIVILIILVVLGGLYYGWEAGVLDLSDTDNEPKNTL